MQYPQRIVFMGSPSFSTPTLERLIQKKYNVIGVYTQPPKPVGRGYKIQPTPVQLCAEKHNLPIFTPKSFQKDPSALSTLKNLNPDLIISIAYGLILPLSVLAIPIYKCLNLHASLLPRWRGSSPLQYALMQGDEKTGVTLMEMEEGLDTGPMLYKEEVTIKHHTTFTELLSTLSSLSADVLEKTLPLYLEKKINSKKQPLKGVTYAPKIKKIDGKLQWDKSADFAIRQLHALSPWPGVYFEYKGINIKVLQAIAIPSPSPNAKPGTSLCEKELIFQCAKGTAIKCTIVQQPGKKAMTCEEFLRGTPINKGTFLL